MASQRPDAQAGSLKSPFRRRMLPRYHNERELDAGEVFTLNT
jgi:hypothetical protein